jgi:hypothetical protein
LAGDRLAPEWWWLGWLVLTPIGHRSCIAVAEIALLATGMTAQAARFKHKTSFSNSRSRDTSAEREKPFQYSTILLGFPTFGNLEEIIDA